MSASSTDQGLLPVRMLNEYVYCPRLFALEHVHGQWADSSDTVRGNRVHARVDRPDDGEIDPERPVSRRSVLLSDDELGLIARIDLVEIEQTGEVVPVDYKQGRPAPTPEGAWEPERVQVAAQALLLRAHGYRCSHGILYFAAARQRVRVELDEALVEATLRWRDEALIQRESAELPPPLEASPKCPRCSLVGICLPDEHHALTSGAQVRPLIPPHGDGLPLYVQRHRCKIGKRGEEVVVREDGKTIDRAPIAQVSQLVVMGTGQVSTQLLHELARRDVPVAFHGYGGWFHGLFQSTSGTNVHTRIAQHAAAADPDRCLELARALVLSKTHNQRILLRRNGRDLGTDVLTRMAELRGDLERAGDVERVRGYEGAIARAYFQSFGKMLKGPCAERFSPDGRSRRPPLDPVNAVLSFLYACLARELTVTLHRIGLDPYVGFLHTPRLGRPALSLDLMEEFRPIIVDSAVLQLFNNGALTEDDFLIRRTGVSLQAPGKRKVLQTYERRLDSEVTHPRFGTRLSYRRVLEVQARLLAKVLTGELVRYPGFQVR